MRVENLFMGFTPRSALIDIERIVKPLDRVATYLMSINKKQGEQDVQTAAFYAAVVRSLKVIELRLEKIENYLTTLDNAAIIEFFTVVDGQRRKVEHMFLKATQKLPIAVAFKDKFGNAAKVDGVPRWAVTDEKLGALETAEDGMSSVFAPSGLAGLLKIQVFADADLGEGVKEILGELEIEVLTGEAVSVELTAGEPVDM